MFPTTYYIKTFGCQMNVSDSERIAGFLESRKFKPAKDITKTDLVIFNTCGVRQMAEDRIYGQIHNIRKQEAESSEQKRKTIVLTGCLSNRKDVQKRLKDKVDLFCEIKDFPEKMTALLARHPERSEVRQSGMSEVEGSAKKYYQKTQKVDSSTSFDQRSHSAQNDECYLNISPKYTNLHTAFVPIMTGCNNFCSYCVVPYARGQEVSRPANEIISEIKRLVEKDYKEIILLGQNVNSYRYEIINSKFRNLKLIKNSKLKIKNYLAGIIIGPLDKYQLPKLEAHLIGFKGNLYGKKIIVTLKKYLRPFKKFKTQAGLIKQIQKDIEKVKIIYGKYPIEKEK
jgi:tRNA A37 methylthiotransferase MiaB